VNGRDKDRVLAQDPEKISYWFALFEKTIADYKIADADIYNMDEKGILLGVIGKVKVILSKYEKQGFLTQDGSREWVTLLECISMEGRRVPPWLIFKGKIN
jgi:hypothetical protein